jgi:hypothetical protein
MGIAVKSAQGIGIAEFGLENDGGVRGFDEPALTGNAELRGEVGMDVGYGLKRCDFCHNKKFFLYYIIILKSGMINFFTSTMNLSLF